MARREFPRKVKAAAFLRAGKHCEGCGNPLLGKFHYDHDIPDQLGGEPTLENCRVLCQGCHSEKTRKQDVPNIAKAKRREQKHVMGIRQPKGQPMAGTKASGWKRKMDGTVERRK